MERARHLSLLDGLCIFILAAEWIGFGSMHFSRLDDTIAMIPNFIPEDLKAMVAIVTGILEVGSGIFVLVPSARKWAALSSLFLLVLLVPAMYKILVDDSALRLAPGSGAMFRWALVPNNLFLAFCSIHLWRSARQPSFG